jgi:hypothetical protein
LPLPLGRLPDRARPLPTRRPLSPPLQAAHGRASQGGLLYTVPEEEVLATKSIQREVAQYGHLNEYVRKKP